MWDKKGEDISFNWFYKLKESIGLPINEQTKEKPLAILAGDSQASNTAAGQKLGDILKSKYRVLRSNKTYKSGEKTSLTIERLKRLRNMKAALVVVFTGGNGCGDAGCKANIAELIKLINKKFGNPEIIIGLNPPAMMPKSRGKLKKFVAEKQLFDKGQIVPQGKPGWSRWHLDKEGGAYAKGRDQRAKEIADAAASAGVAVADPRDVLGGDPAKIVHNDGIHLYGSLASKWAQSISGKISGKAGEAGEVETVSEPEAAAPVAPGASAADLAKRALAKSKKCNAAGFIGFGAEKLSDKHAQIVRKLYDALKAQKIIAEAEQHFCAPGQERDPWTGKCKPRMSMAAPQPEPSTDLDAAAVAGAPQKKKLEDLIGMEDIKAASPEMVKAYEKCVAEKEKRGEDPFECLGFEWLGAPSVAKGTGNFCADPNNEGKNVPMPEGMGSFICKDGTAVRKDKVEPPAPVVQADKFGKEMLAGLLKAQQDLGLKKVDGCLGPITAKKLGIPNVFDPTKPGGIATKDELEQLASGTAPTAVRGTGGAAAGAVAGAGAGAGGVVQPAMAGLTREDIAFAKKYKFDPKLLQAFAKMESGGKGFAPTDPKKPKGPQRMVIRFEPAVFVNRYNDERGDPKGKVPYYIVPPNTLAEAKKLANEYGLPYGDYQKKYPSAGSRWWKSKDGKKAAMAGAKPGVGYGKFKPGLKSISQLRCPYDPGRKACRYQRKNGP